MADHPEAEQVTTADRTSALVAAGLVLSAVVGVATIFSESIAAAWSRTSPAASEASAPMPAAHGPDGGRA
jgi:hypothetical protein